MNHALRLFNGDGKLNMEKLNDDVIVECLPDHIWLRFIELGGKNITSKYETKDLLEQLEEAEEKRQTINEKKNNKKKTIENSIYAMITKKRITRRRVTRKEDATYLEIITSLVNA